MKQATAFLTVILLSALIGCQTPTSQPTQVPPIPKNSLAMISPEKPVYRLGQDAYKSLTTYIANKYQCNNFTIDKTEYGKADKELLIDGHGQLWKGTASETWHITMCGKSMAFVMVFTPDGKGGSFIAIAELSASHS